MTVTPLNARTAERLRELDAETVNDRIRRLQAEARALNPEQVQAMRAHQVELIEAAREVIANASQSEGIRQLAAKILREGEGLLSMLDALRVRMP